MARWKIELLGDAPDTALLVALFTGPELRVVKDEDCFLLEAHELEDIQHHSDVLRVARDVVTRVNGAARLEHGSYRNVQVGPVHERRADGTRATTVFVEPATIDVRASVFRPTIVGRVGTESVATPARHFVEIAARDQDAHEALDLWADPQHNWMNLYKVFEIIRSRGGTSLGGVKSKDLSRFRHTANHEKAGGRDARHARLGTDPPKDPMSLPEADQLVRRLLEAWLQSLS
jgi:hypothetical protein